MARDFASKFYGQDLRALDEGEQIEQDVLNAPVELIDGASIEGEFSDLSPGCSFPRDAPYKTPM